MNLNIKLCEVSDDINKRYVICRYKYTFQKSDKDREGLWDRQKNSAYYERRKHVDQHHDDEDGTKDRFWDHNRTSGNVFDRRRYQGSGLYNNYHHHDDEEKEPEWMKGVFFYFLFEERQK